jgi:hypothetical protein
MTRPSNVLQARDANRLATVVDRIKKDRKNGLELDSDNLAKMLEVSDLFGTRVALELIVMVCGGKPQDNDAGKAAAVLWDWSDNPAPRRPRRKKR